MKNIIFALLLLCFGCTSDRLTPREQLIKDLQELTEKYKDTEPTAVAILHVLTGAMLAGDEKEFFYVTKDFASQYREELKKRIQQDNTR